ncbi:ACT domain-containing protein [Turicimonas muris]|nr:ACT domain-containing protein [Turicimonas muris]
MHFNFTIEIKNSEDLKRTLNALREIKNVVSARRK